MRNDTCYYLEPSIRPINRLCYSFATPYSIAPIVLPWTPRKTAYEFQRSRSESLLLEGQTQERHRSCKESVKPRTVPSFIDKGRRDGRRYVVLAFSVGLISLSTRLNLTRQSMLVTISVYFGCFSFNNGASEASTRSTMNSCFPIIRAMSFTILRESSRVALTNSRSWKISFDASAEKRNCETNCMRYGADYGFHDYDNWQSCCEVLHPNG